MTKAESKYFNTAAQMDEAFLSLLEKKDFEYITVKEICQKAGVNRSTFYLHYETIGDLLSECISRANEEFMSCFSMTAENFACGISDTPTEELFLITPQYLLPYLSFIRANKTLFKVTLSKPGIMGADKTYDKIFSRILNPILERYGVPVSERQYMLSFYVEGSMGIVKHWLSRDCEESDEDIADIMMKVIRK
ncbi:MAG: TetR/AcrR family transcriptional regulator [Firmicutes bacterium]|nr:TetR/AcrR family transcriptional regulator [Bacillota bacterium]